MDLKDIRLYIDDRPGERVFRVHRDVFCDPALFELEERYIFARTWNFLAHESQIAQSNDFISSALGRVPIIVMRDGEGRIGAFLNACRHKGAMLTRVESGNRKFLVCAYHGWAYGTDGKNANIKDREAARYAAGFDADSHDLMPLPKLANYRGFIFGSLNPEVPPIESFLGEMRFFIDLAVDQGAGEMEFVPGRIAFVYDGNWKLQMDNGIDAYHLTSTHAGFLDIMAKRSAGQGHVDAKMFDWQKRYSQEAGSFQFANGHAAIWLNQAEVAKRPIYPRIRQIAERVGQLRADWMLKSRNTTIFPNMQIADATNLLVRVARPLAVDKTEVRYWCFAPKDETAEQRAWRLRQFEDFFNVSGFATPDDTVLYEDCQRGYAATPVEWLQGYSRGVGAEHAGADEVAAMAGLKPVSSAKSMFDLASEVCFHPLYREWARLMHAGVTGTKAYE
jgi:benzoate/toluate 1,2-dioxygenase alpha subunit/2,4,5-trichlorophenoxyacetic acid oxygenase 1